jgi:phenylacetyl-CoA:acceptor oxidoreductase subunit 1
MNTPDKPHRWGMVIDINRCVGCQTCTIACKHANDTTPGVKWRNVLDVEHGTFPNVQREFLVVGCQHCANPSCVPVCPTGATRQREDGLVTMDYDTCIGCGYCAVACPYQARTIVSDPDWYYGVETAQELTVSHDERRGTAQKCTFCVERIDDALAEGKTPGVDLEYTPACAASCLTQAIQFGDFNDPNSNVSVLASDRLSFQMHEELGNDPQIKYLYDIPVTPGHEMSEEDVDDLQSNPDGPLAGQRQTFWDYRAAMNFTLGGMSSGLGVLATLNYWLGNLDLKGLISMYAMACILMAVGLFFVFLEISRKARFMNVLLRPQSSWMTRETYFVAILYPGLVLEHFIQPDWLHAVMGLSFLGFLYSQARILFAGKGIPAWRAPLVPWLLISTGLLEGAGLLILGAMVFGLAEVAPTMLTSAGSFAVTTGLLWILYRRTAKAQGIPPLARQVIDSISPYLLMLGYALPTLALSNENFSGSALAVTLAALAVVGGGVLLKFSLITRACYFQGFALPKVPFRGSGTRAAPVKY